MANVKNIVDSDFKTQVLQSPIPVLVDFWAPWCGPCVAMGPVLDQVAGEMANRLTICKMNVDENPETPADFGVRSIPYMVLFKNGTAVDTIVGAVPKNKLVDMINKHLPVA
jgi:thioredoxin 1